MQADQLSNDGGDETCNTPNRERRIIQDEALTGATEEEKSRLKYIQKRRYEWITAQQKQSNCVDNLCADVP